MQAPIRWGCRTADLRTGSLAGRICTKFGLHFQKPTRWNVPTADLRTGSLAGCLCTKFGHHFQKPTRWGCRTANLRTGSLADRLCTKFELRFPKPTRPRELACFAYMRNCAQTCASGEIGNSFSLSARLMLRELCTTNPLKQKMWSESGWGAIVLIKCPANIL